MSKGLSSTFVNIARKFIHLQGLPCDLALLQSRASSNFVGHSVSGGREDDAASTVNKEGVSREQLSSVSLLILEVQLA